MYEPLIWIKKIKTRTAYWAVLLWYCWVQPFVAQSQELGSWSSCGIKYNLNERWSVFAEAQLRSLHFYNNFHYYEYKGGINYKITPHFIITFALGDYDTYQEGGNFVVPKNNDEFRIWNQLALLQNIGIFKIEQRYRLEARYTQNGYRNRFRYRLQVAYPFGNTTRKGYAPFQVAAANEIFFTDKEPYFERNRISATLGYKIAPYCTFSLGYLQQFDYKINDEIGRDFLQASVLFEFSDAKKNK